MAVFEFRSATEQVADYLRGEINRRRWNVRLPGSNALAAELGVGKGTIESALALLEQEGLLVSQGRGRPRRIDLAKRVGAPSCSIQILLGGELDRSRTMMIELERQLQSAGYAATFSTKTLESLRMQVKRVARFVEETEADGWIVLGGNHEILQWFAEQPRPVYAIFGRQATLDLAGVSICRAAALARAVQRLVELGHRRIVLLTRPDRRKPGPGLFERQFLDTLARYGIHTGSFNLPDWEDDPEDFRDCLDGLFSYTPPTALIFDQTHLYFAAQQHLAQRGLVAPKHVSMLCNDPDMVFRWAVPKVSHIHWDSDRLIRHARRWVGQLARGKERRKKSLVEAEFVEGGTIGPAPRTASA
ncbi:MAG TPA: substrate-binding domain-containing protein [Opitutales bacterium]|nr:substrate-binding domain-containing protein [Opitutales bacterium]